MAPKTHPVMTNKTTNKHKLAAPGKGPKWTMGSDDAWDAKRGIKEDSKADKALDKKRGVK